MKPTYEELEAFALWARQKQPAAIAMMERNGLRITTLGDPMQKLAFTLYTDLVEIAGRVDEMFGDGLHQELAARGGEWEDARR